MERFPALIVLVNFISEGDTVLAYHEEHDCYALEDGSQMRIEEIKEDYPDSIDVSRDELIECLSRFIKEHKDVNTR